MKYVSNSEKDTRKLAEDVAKKLTGGEVIGLVGELGAGKTAFAKGLAKALKIKKNVVSPTFVLMKVYPIDLKGSKIKQLVHIDAYRLTTAEDLIAIGAGEYFSRPDTVMLIEWADRIKKLLPKKTSYLEFKTIGENKREIKKR